MIGQKITLCSVLHASRFATPIGARAITMVCLALVLSACTQSPDDAAAKTAAAAQKPAAQIAGDAPANESPLARMVARGDLAGVRQLIDEGADVGAKDAMGRTSLHVAAFYGRPKTAELLIAHGAEVNSKDRVGMTPLHAATLVGDLSEIEVLLNSGADIQAVDDNGLTALHLAAAIGQWPVIKLLIQRGADPLSKDRYEYTPGFYASRNHHPKTAAQLQLAAGKK